STEENTVIDPTLTVTTDQADYAPDSTATITAENVTVGGTVEFVVTDLDTTNGTVSGTNETWTVTDGGAVDLNGVTDGTIVTTWQVNQDAAGEAFVVTATDTTTSDTATAAFTDTPRPPGPTVTASDFTITVNPDGTITASVYLDVENGT